MWYTYRWMGTPSAVAAAVAGRSNVIGPSTLTAGLALDLGLTGIANIAITLAQPKAVVCVRSLTPLATPAGCTDMTDDDNAKVVGIWQGM